MRRLNTDAYRHPRTGMSFLEECVLFVLVIAVIVAVAFLSGCGGSGSSEPEHSVAWEEGRAAGEYRLDTYGSFDLVGYCSNAAVLYAVTHIDEGDEDQPTDDFSDGCLSV